MKQKTAPAENNLFIGDQFAPVPPMSIARPETLYEPAHKSYEEPKQKTDCGCKLEVQAHIMIKFTKTTEGKQMWYCFLHNCHIIEEDRKV
jgi:hypothetical protein